MDIFQGSQFVELLSMHGSKPLDNWQVVHGAQYLATPDNKKEQLHIGDGGRVYCKDLKGYCFTCKGSQRLQFPPKNIKSKSKKYFIY